MPQDIEWAYAAGRFHLLQARDVTGVDFSWDEEVDAWQTLPEEPEVIWTRGFADEYWTGAITPLFYSVRAREHTASYCRSACLWGIAPLAEARIFRYREAEAYLSTRSQAIQIARLLPKSFRNGPALSYLPPSMRAAVAAAPFPVLGYLRMYARIQFINPRHSIRGWLDTTRHHMAHRVGEANGLDDAALQRLSDTELRQYTDERMEFMASLLEFMWSGFQIHGASALYLLGALLARWYDGDNGMVYADLITGLPQRTITMEENLALWDLAAEIRRDEALLELFRTSDAQNFFQRLEQHPAGAAASRMYRRLVEEHGHRGHADRDFYYARRAEDPAIDYRSLKALLSGGGERPDAMEARLVARREAAVADVVGRLRRKPFGALRVAAFRRLHAYVLDFLVLRDDERHYLDRVTLSKKRAFREIGRRLRERGVLAGEDNFYFLTREELYEALEGRAPARLFAARISGRRRQFDRFFSKEYIPPLYLRGREAFHDAGETAAVQQQGDVLCGMPTSRGCISGRARIVLELAQIGALEQGDILVTNSTDPGWTPVFSLIGGLVLETGGMLSHGACLSREYNLPAVTIANAAKRIEDGAWVALDGNTGQLRVLDGPPPAAAG
jgi:pyruvate,water dikinase